MSATLRRSFGNRVAELRRANGLSQEALADRCGFARSYMSRIERGRANPSLDALATLAAGLDVEPADLFATTDTMSRLVRGHGAIAREKLRLS